MDSGDCGEQADVITGEKKQSSPEALRDWTRDCGRPAEDGADIVVADLIALVSRDAVAAISSGKADVWCEGQRGDWNDAKAMAG